MKKREIIIVIAVIAFGIIYNAIRSGDFDFSIRHGIPSRAWKLKDKSYPRDFTQEEISLPRVDKIEIHNPAGDIIVEKSPAAADDTNGPTIRIQPLIRVYHKNKASAENISKEIKLVTQDTTETNATDKEQKKLLRIDINEKDDFPLNRARVYFKVIIPEAVELNLINRYGDVVVNGCGSAVTLDEKYGDIVVKNVQANLDITNKEGRVAISDVKGQVDLNSRNSRIKINNVSGLKLDCRLSNAYITQVETLTNIENAAYSSITLEESSECSIDGRHTKIKLRNINNNIRVKNSHNSIIMENIQGNINIDANNCKIYMDEITSEDVVIKNSYNYVSIEDISARNLDILMNKGDLDIAFNQLEDKINIKNRHSKITLIYPPSIKPLYNIEVNYGNVTNRTSEELTVVQERSRMLVNSPQAEGKPEIVITNTYGDVYLENKSE